METKTIKSCNRKLIWNYIKSQGAVSKQDIVIGLNLSLPTVTQNVRYLEERGLVSANGKITNTGGRNATAYNYLSRAKVSIGIDISANHVGCAMMDLSGNVLLVIRRRKRFAMEDEYYKYLGNTVEEIINRVGIEKEKVLGVGIAVPGLVSEDGSVVTYGTTMNFTGATIEQFGKYIPYTTQLFHDASVAGYAEVQADAEISDAFYINLCATIGGSVLIDKKVYTGENRKSGEIGHLTLEPGGKVCYCGQRGCLETCCNSRVLSEHTNGNLKEFFDQLKEGREEIRRVWEVYLDYLARGIKEIRMFFDSKVIVGGYVGVYIDEYMDELIRRVNEKNPFDDDAAKYLIACKYKIEATAAGAALTYINAFIDSI